MKRRDEDEVTEEVSVFLTSGLIRNCCAVIIMIFVLPAVLAAPFMTVESPGIVHCGRNFTVNITVYPRGNEVFGAEYVLRFDPSVLHVCSQSNGTFLSHDGVYTIIHHSEDNENGAAIYGETRSGVGGVTDPGVLATITFKAERCGKTCMLNITEARSVVYDSINETYSSVDAEVLNGTVEIEPSSPFNITGYVFYENGSVCENPNVTVENMNTSVEWTANTTSNRYMLNLSYGPDLLVGEVLRFNVTSEDKSMFNMTYHTITSEDVEAGGICLNITVGELRKPDLVVADVWVCWPENCKICYKIMNTGDDVAPAGHRTVLLIDFAEAAYDVVNVSLLPGENHTGCFDGQWTYTPPKDDIMVCADDTEIVDEHDENNNHISTVWKCGDVNNDAWINIFDAVKTLNRATDPDFPVSCPWAADVNADGSINIFDAVKILNRATDPGFPLRCKCEL